MGTVGSIVRKVKRLFVVTALLAFWLASNNVSAYPNLDFHGGVTRNYVVDVIFWGTNFTEQDRADVRAYIVNFSQYVNGQYNPPGMEPAIHYYGLWGMVPGVEIDDVSGNPNAGIADTFAVQEISRATSGAAGPATDFSGNWSSDALPASYNRLPVIVAKGLRDWDVGDANCGFLTLNPCTNDIGFHDYNSSGYPYAVALFDDGTNSDGTPNIVFPTALSHEIQEAMTNPYFHDSPAWTTDDGFGGWTHAEACDACNSTDTALSWTSASSGRNISGVSDVTLNPSYGGVNSIGSDTCQIWEPQQYAPIAAVDGVVIYRTPDGRIEELYFDSDRSAPSGPFDLGSLPGGVLAQGKPVLLEVPAARIPGTGEYIFVRGSDNGLYMNYNQTGWTHLGAGGTFFGDPSAVYWYGGANVNVFVLGMDDNLYTFGIVQGVPGYWLQVPAIIGPGTTGDGNVGQAIPFSGPPKVFSRTGATIDLFAVDEAGALWTIPFSTSGGWTAPFFLNRMPGSSSLLSHDIGAPIHTPVSITSWGTNELDLLVTAENDVAHQTWNGPSGPDGGWYNPFNSITSQLGSNSPSGTPAIVSWGPNRLDAFMVDRQNRLMHAYYDGSWHASTPSPLAWDAVGDPVALSRSQGQLEVYYRTTSGSLSQAVWDGGSWSWNQDFLPNNSVQ